MDEKTDSEDSESSSEEEESPRKVKTRLSKIEKEHAILSEKLQTKRKKKHKQVPEQRVSRSNSHSHMDIPASMVRSVSSDFHSDVRPDVRSEPPFQIDQRAETRPERGNEYVPSKNGQNAFNQMLRRLIQGGMTTDRNVTTFVVIILMGLAALYIADKLFSLNGK